MTSVSSHEPRWDVPFPYGQAGAIESMGSVAAPFLAGLSATLAVLVISSEEAFRWPGAALFLLVGASLSLIAALQFTFWARRYTVTPAEIQAWWPGLPADDAELIWEQKFQRKRQQAWTKRARRAYNCGLLFFLAALPVVLVPAGHATECRLAVIALAVLGFALEVAWLTLAARKMLDKRERA